MTNLPKILPTFAAAAPSRTVRPRAYQASNGAGRPFVSICKESHMGRSRLLPVPLITP